MSWLERWRGVHWDPPWDAGWLFVLVILGAVVYAAYIYRRNDAPLRPGFRFLLTALRGLSLTLLVVILCRPVLSLAVPGGAARGVLVLLDRSQSLTLPGADPEQTRDLELRGSAEGVQEVLGGSYPLVFRGFAAGLGPVVETLPPPPPEGDATNLTAALERGLVEGITDGRPGAMVLISDGAQTTGPDPVPLARRLGIPVQVVALGSPEAVPDLAVTRVRANREAFAGEQTPVEAVVRLRGLEGTTVRVQLLDVTDDEVQLAETTGRVEPLGAEQRLPMTFVPNETGLRFLEVRVPELPGEATADNNRRLVSIRVREEKTGVLVLSGRLTWDHTFLRRSLEADSTLTVSAGFWRSGGFRRDLGSPALPDLSATGLQALRVLVLDHVAPSQIGASGLEALAGFVRGGGGLMVVTGGGDQAVSEWQGTPLESLLPVGSGRIAPPAESQVRLTPEGRRHAVFDATVPGAPPPDVWANLPPLVPAQDLGSVKAHAEALMISDGAVGLPVLSWNRAGQGSVVMLAAGGIWKWGFMSAAHGPGGDVVPGWWRRLAHWLARPGVETRVDIRPENDVVAKGGTVTFVARVTDEAYRPVPDATVDLTVLPATGSEEEPRSFQLGGADGFYSGVVGGLPPGRYRYRGNAHTESTALGTVEGEFAVDSLGTEMERLEADHELLERIATVSGGRLWHPDSLDELDETFSVMAQEEEERTQLALWDHPAIFVAFVLLVSAEWFLRRRRGLV